jgi:hypothetical protein
VVLRLRCYLSQTPDVKSGRIAVLPQRGVWLCHERQGKALILAVAPFPLPAELKPQGLAMGEE